MGKNLGDILRDFCMDPLLLVLQINELHGYQASLKINKAPQ
jgi:hypothetical protein